MEHDLKIWPQHYHAVKYRQKRVELRFDDRDYREADILCLREWDPETKEFVGSEPIRVRVTHVTRNCPQLAEGCVALSFYPIS